MIRRAVSLRSVTGKYSLLIVGKPVWVCSSVLFKCETEVVTTHPISLQKCPRVYCSVSF